MKRFFSLLICILIMISAVSGAFSASAYAESINVYNWGEYIDQSVLDTFYEETGIKVNYTTYDSNESMYSKIVSGAANYDVIIPSDYMISKMASEGYLAKLNFDNIPNYRYIDDAYKGLEYDPNEEYSVSYTWSVVAVIYNNKYVAEEDVKSESIDLLWNEKYAGKILMFDNPRDAFALALKKAGHSLNSTNESDWREAYELLDEQKPLVQAYVMDQIFDKMKTEEAYVAAYYAGDAYVIAQDNPNIDFYVPKEGSNFFTDAMCVLETSQHKTEAEMFINFMCRDDIAYKNAMAIGYGTPQVNVYKMLDKSLTEDERIYPTAETIEERTEVFINLPANIQMLQSSLWTKLKVETEDGSSDTGYDIAFFVIISLLIVFLIFNTVKNYHRKKLWRM